MTIDKTANGTLVLPLWLVFLVGGTFRQENGGYATYPGGVLRQTRRYWRFPSPRGSWWRFVDPRPSYGLPGGPPRKQAWFRTVKVTGAPQP